MTASKGKSRKTTRTKTKEPEDVQKTLAKQKKDLTDLRRKLREADKKIAERDKGLEKLEELQRKIHSLEEANQELEIISSEYMEMLEDAQVEKKNLEKTHHALTKHNDALSEELESLKEQVPSLDDNAVAQATRFYIDLYHDKEYLRGRIEHALSRDKKAFQGLDQGSIIKFITGHIPEDALLSDAPNADASKKKSPQSDKVSLEILETIVRAGEPGGQTSDKLVTHTRFKITGPQAKKVVSEAKECRVEIYTVDVSSQESKLVTYEYCKLDREKYEYTSQQEFGVPTLGKYEIHTLAIMLPPLEIMAHHDSPTINVVE